MFGPLIRNQDVPFALQSTKESRSKGAGRTRPAITETRRANDVTGQSRPCSTSNPDRKPPQYAADVSSLAEELIERCCGTHSLGLIYQFLRNTGNEADARVDFELFLSGTLSQRLLDAASCAIRDDRPGARQRLVTRRRRLRSIPEVSEPRAAALVA